MKKRIEGISLVKSKSKPKIHSLKFNALMNMVLSSSSLLFPVISIPYVSRVLNPAGMGSVTFVQSIATYFSLFALLGASTYGVRACAQIRDDRVALSKLVEELIIILFISTTFVFSIYILCLFFIPKFKSNLVLFLIFGFAIWLASFGVEWFYQAIEQYSYITIRSICFKVVGLFLMFSLVKNSKDYCVYGGIVVFTGYGANLLNMARLLSFVSLQPISSLNLKRHIRPMLSFFVSSVSSGIYSQADIVLLGFMTNPAAVGLYQLVAKIKNILVLMINSVVNVMLPRLSYYIKKDKAKYYSLLIKNLYVILIFSFGGIMYSILCAKQIVLLLGGVQYANSSFALLFILPSLLFVSLNTVFSQYLISKGMDKQYAFTNICGIFFSILYCLILVPHFGIVGAAASCSLCEFSTLLIRLFFAKDFLIMYVGKMRLYPSPVSAFLSFACVSLICRRLYSVNLFFYVVIVGLFYSIIYLFFLFVLKDVALMNLLSRVKFFRKKVGKN